jgi:LPXTG-motif cell wall-anchored protein
MSPQVISYFAVLGITTLVGLIALAWPKKKEKK